jgi:hypothetical protein
MSAWEKSAGPATAALGEAKKFALPFGFSEEFDLARGECLRALMVLDANARLERSAVARPLMLWSEASELWHNTSADYGEDFGGTKRSVELNAGCTDKPVRVRVLAGRVKKPLPGTYAGPIGTGDVFIRLYKSRVTDAEWEKILAQRSDGMKRLKAHEDSLAARDQRTCDECKVEWLRCVRNDPSSKPDTCKEYRSCLERRLVQVGSCKNI